MDQPIDQPTNLNPSPTPASDQNEDFALKTPPPIKPTSLQTNKIFQKALLVVIVLVLVISGTWLTFFMKERQTIGEKAQTTGVTCNGTCTSSDQCQTGLVCSSGKCRAGNCPKVEDCNCTKGCGGRCDTGSDVGWGICDSNQGVSCHLGTCGIYCSSNNTWDTTDPCNCQGPTPTPVGCNGTCNTSLDCQTGLICSSNYCRAGNCPKVENCNCTKGCGGRCDTGSDVGWGICNSNEGISCHFGTCGKDCGSGVWDTTAPCNCQWTVTPTPVPCNYTCITSVDCQTSSTGLVCYEGKCRAGNCTKVDDCNCTQNCGERCNTGSDLGWGICNSNAGIGCHLGTCGKDCGSGVWDTTAPCDCSGPAPKGHCERCDSSLLPIYQCVEPYQCTNCGGIYKCVRGTVGGCNECITPVPPTPTPTRTTTCGCTGVKLFNTSNQEVSPSNVTAGQTIKIGVLGIGTNQWKARVKVTLSGSSTNLIPPSACRNSILIEGWCEASQYLPTMGYYVSFTIPSQTGNYQVTGQICCGTSGNSCTWTF